MCDVPYRVYSKKSVLDKAIEYRKKERKRRGSIPAAVALFFSFGHRSFSLLYKPSYFTGYDHLEFYAGSEGLETFSDTGYMSIFIPAYSDGIYSLSEIKDSILKMLKREAGLDLMQKEQPPLQLTLF